MLLDLVRWDLAVIFEDTASDGVNVFYFFVVPFQFLVPQAN